MKKVFIIILIILLALVGVIITKAIIDRTKEISINSVGEIKEENLLSYEQFEKKICRSYAAVQSAL